jgi:hypothetical protein
MEDEPDAAAALAAAAPEYQRTEEEEWPAWSDYMRTAWSALRDDRHVGAMGGMGRIYWTAIHAYAERQGLSGSAFDDFETFIRAMDDEFMRHISEKQKAKDKANS